MFAPILVFSFRPCFLRIQTVCCVAEAMLIAVVMKLSFFVFSLFQLFCPIKVEG